SSRAGIFSVGTQLSQPGARCACQIQVSAPPSLPKGPQSLVISCTVCSLWSSPLLSAVSWSSPVLSAVSWPSPVLCPQSLVISCTMSAVSGHLLYYFRSLWSSPVLCPQ
ncbi:unnamed protein product, partial [Staurois parvus]